MSKESHSQSPKKFIATQSPIQKRLDTKYNINNILETNQDDNKEKDILIAKLKATNFELEHNEKEHLNINKKYRNLQNELNQFKDEKQKQEYEFKETIESANIKYNILRDDYETLKLSYSDKKLYGDLKDLEVLLIEKNEELNHLNTQVEKLDRYSQEIVTLTSLNHKEVTIRKECEKRIQELEFMLKDKQNNIKDLEYMLSEKLNDKNKKIQELEHLLQEKIGEINIRSNEVNNVKNKIDKVLDDKKDLEHILKEKINELNKKSYEHDNINSKSEKLIDDNKKLFKEIEKLHSQKMVLSEQNQNFISQVANLIEQNERISKILGLKRNEKLSNFFNKNNKLKIESTVTTQLDTNVYSPNNLNMKGFNSTKVKKTLNKI